MTIEELKQALEANPPVPWKLDVSDGWAVIRAGNAVVLEDWMHEDLTPLIVAAVNNLPKLLKVAEAAAELSGGSYIGVFATGPVVRPQHLSSLRKALEAFK